MSSRRRISAHVRVVVLGVLGFCLLGVLSPKNAAVRVRTQTGVNEANQFVTLARDGKLLFWDIRVKKDKKTGEIVWTPLYTCLLTRLEVPGDLSGHSFSFSVMEVCDSPQNPVSCFLKSLESNH